MKILIESFIIIIVLIGIYYSYKTIYVHYMNKSIKNHLSKVKLMDINLVRIGILFVAIILTSSNTVLAINSENKKEVIDYPEAISIFDEMVYGDSVLEHFYLEYNSFFGGYYIQDGNIIICITVDTPQDGIKYLDDAFREYKFVNISYSQLQDAFNFVVRIAMEEGYIGVGINHRDNVIRLYVKPDTIVSPALIGYINGGIVEVIPNEGTIVNTFN